MASSLQSSAQASMPSSTAPALYSFPFPSIFPSATGALTWGYTVLTIVAALLILEQSVYRIKKRHLPGDSWTIPVIGKFADSLKPTMEGYMKQWNSGPLSALSVFNMFVFFGFWCRAVHKFTEYSFIVMASSNEFSRKILNSPNHAEPCLVHSAKQILCADNWCVYFD
jgi:C-22 sterol desaturase